MKLLKKLLSVSILNWVILLVIMFQFPKQVPIHLDYTGMVDRYGPRWVILIFGFIPVILDLALMAYRAKTKNNTKASANRKTENILFLAVTFFMLVITWLQVYVASLADQPQVPHLLIAPIILVPLGILLIVISNFFGVIKQNRWMGIRVSWTLKDEEVWKRTHRLGGYYGVAGGFCILIGGIAAYFTGNVIWAFSLLAVGVILIVVVPIIYAGCLYHKRHSKNRE